MGDKPDHGPASCAAPGVTGPHECGGDDGGA